ncbi:unnamed protein product [Allacma fusca]|uniref:Uncharacterized protein n=1 Tax=Allacma fusca TaxID=39272 RepID=A0A8J2K7F3_9HEXA|nr:unnamed protein product [Allacma fusca]
MLHRMKRRDEGSDTEGESTDIFFHMPRFARNGARHILNQQHEIDFVDQMIGCLETDVKQYEPEPEDLPQKCEFDPSEMIRDSISSWRLQRNLLSSALSKSKLSEKSTKGSGNKWEGIKTRNKFRRDAHSLHLNEFLTTLEAKISGAASEVQGTLKWKAELKPDSILERPAQMIQLQETEAGTSLDELRDARKKVLQKLSTNCADWIVKHCSPSANRVELQEALKRDLQLLNTGSFDTSNPVNKSTGDDRFGLTLADSIFELTAADDVCTSTNISDAMI